MKHRLARAKSPAAAALYAGHPRPSASIRWCAASRGCVHQHYLPQGSVAIGWAETWPPAAGTTSHTVRQATIDRVNYYRAHAGARRRGAMAAARPAARSGGADVQREQHDQPFSARQLELLQLGRDCNGKSISRSVEATTPPARTPWICTWSSASGTGGWASALDSLPPQVRMDSGTIPNQGAQAAANSLWVISGLEATHHTKWCGWPPRGCVPWQVLPSVQPLVVLVADASPAPASMGNGCWVRRSEALVSGPATTPWCETAGVL